MIATLVTPPIVQSIDNHHAQKQQQMCVEYRFSGICRLCEKLDMDPLEDVRVLVLLWKMGANKKPAEIQREEWMAGCRRLNLYSLEKFRALLPGLDTGFLDREEFGDFYKVRALRADSPSIDSRM